jgi:hypothetical protein
MPALYAGTNVNFRTRSGYEREAFPHAVFYRRKEHVPD